MPCYLVAALLLCFAAPAHAYIDAGSGSYMLQVGLATALAAVFALKGQMNRIRGLVSRLLAGRHGARAGK